MSHANKEATTKFLSAMGIGDVATVKSLTTFDMTLVAMGSSVLAGTLNRDTFLRAVEGIVGATRAGVTYTFNNLTAEGDRVAVEAAGNSVMRDGTPYNNHYLFLLFFRDGKVCRVHEYHDAKLVDAVVVPRLPK